jgi:hypothetical protein
MVASADEASRIEGRFHMLRPALFGLLLAAAAWSDALAQSQAAVQKGQRVRVRFAAAHTPDLVGVVRAIRTDTLVVSRDSEPGGRMVTAFPLSSVSRLQVSRGRHSRWGRGLLIGLGAGAVTGAILGATVQPDWFFTRRVLVEMGAVVFAPIGGAVGVVIGALTKTEQWETVPLPGSRGAAGAGMDARLTLGLRVAL